MKFIKKNVTRKTDAEYWEAKAKEWERLYRLEMLTNQAWLNSILNATLIGKVSLDGQQAIYALHNSEMESIRKLMNN